MAQVDKGNATELPEGLGRALREAITRQDIDYDIYATAGTFMSLDECVNLLISPTVTSVIPRHVIPKRSC